LTQEEIETLITNPDPQTPSHHQVDQRIIKVYLTGERVPTYLPGHRPSRYFGILPTYLPRDQFLPSEWVVPLVDAQYCRNYQIWKHRWDANTRATDFLVDHLRDPSDTISQVIEAPVHIPFIPTVRAAELRWWNGYFNTYHSFDDLILLGGHYQKSFYQRAIRTVSWHTGKSAQDINATALTTLQVGQPIYYSTLIQPEWRTGKALRFHSSSITKSRFGYTTNYNLLTSRPLTMQR
jgi:hypothetical protein